MASVKGGQSKKTRVQKKPEFEVIFESMDLNHDGRISVTELVKASRQLGWNPTKAEAEQMIADCNPAQEGYVTKREFMNLFKERQADIKKEEEELKEAFHVFDKDNSGTISAGEIKAVLRAVGENVDDEEVNEMIRACDTDGDGNISINEFTSLMCELG